MSISRKDIEHVARLARLGLSEEELERYAKDLAQIIPFVEQLNEVDTTGVDPVAHISGVSNVVRKDVVTESLSREDALRGAPDQHRGQVRVKGVFS